MWMKLHCFTVCSGINGKRCNAMLFCCNADRIKKLRPLVVGKFETPHCLKTMKHYPRELKMHALLEGVASLFRLNSVRQGQKHSVPAWQMCCTNQWWSRWKAIGIHDVEWEEDKWQNEMQTLPSYPVHKILVALSVLDTVQEFV